MQARTRYTPEYIHTYVQARPPHSGIILRRECAKAVLKVNYNLSDPEVEEEGRKNSMKQHSHKETETVSKTVLRGLINIRAR